MRGLQLGLRQQNCWGQASFVNQKHSGSFSNHIPITVHLPAQKIFKVLNKVIDFIKVVGRKRFGLIEQNISIVVRIASRCQTTDQNYVYSSVLELALKPFSSEDLEEPRTFEPQ